MYVEERIIIRICMAPPLQIAHGFTPTIYRVVFICKIVVSSSMLWARF